MLCGHRLWHPHPITVITSKTTDYHNKYTNDAKIQNIAKITKMLQGDTKWANRVKKNGASKLAQCSVATNLQFVKNGISVKVNKQSAVEQGVSVDLCKLFLLHRTTPWDHK